MQLCPELDERVHIAWLYYMDGLTQSEIADRLGLSRLVVHRLLQRCQQEGLVHVVINHPQAYCKSLGSQMEAAYGLKNVVVIPTSSDDQALKRNLGTVSARIITRYLKPGITVGVGWGSTLAQTVRFMEKRNVSPITVVSLLGDLIKSAGSNSYEVALQLANTLDATCYNYVAPILVDSEQDRNDMLRLGHIQAIHNIIRSASIAIVGVGEVSSESSLVTSGALGTEDIRSLIAAGAVADLNGNFINPNGQLADVDVNRRIFATDLETLSKIENVFAVAGGLRKVQAISAALNSGCIGHLITDAQTAEQILQVKRNSSA